MDIAAYLQCFENSMASYTGDDPLDSWDKFVNFLEQKVPAGGGGGISLVLDTLVQRFLSVERYANDVRFVNYCIRCAGFYSDPVALYGLVFGRGVGTRAAVLYVNWAQQFEQKGMMEQADAVYQKALENRAQPADAVLHEYRQFQTRTRGQPQPPVPAGDRAPLQDQSNWMSSHRESPDQNKPPVDRAPAPPPNKTTVIVSRSETSGSLPSSSGAGAPAVPGYLKDELVCPGSEWSFEEVRAHKYFRKVREQQEAEQREQRELVESRLRQQEDEVWRIRSMVDQINQDLEIYGASAGTPQQVWRPPSAPPSSRRSLAVGAQAAPADGRGLQASHHPSVTPDWTTHLAPAEGTAAPAEGTAAPAEGTAAPTGAESLSRASPDREGLALHRPTCQDASQVHERSAVCRDGSRLLEPDERLDVSQGGAANLSHVTPNSSLGFVQATPSRVLPSPTVNTREALGVIMDMFQAPTFVEEPFSTSQLHAAGGDSRDGGSGHAGCTSSLPKPPAAALFTIFQDGDGDKENCRAAAPPAAGEPRPPRPLAEVAAAKADRPNDTPPELAPDESTMWGARYNSLHCLDACPNSTTDFALLARYVSTPSTHKGVFYQDQENGDGGDADDNAFTRCQTKKLSPIIEQSPRDDEVSRLGAMVRSSERLGTIVGEGHGLTSSSLTMAQPPPHAALSFRDQTLAQPPPHAALSFRDHTLAQPPPHAALSFRDHTLVPAGPGWEVYTSPREPPQTAPFRILEDSAEPPHPEPAPAQASDVPMSPECPLKAGWFPAGSPEAPAEADLDAFLSPCRPRTRDRTSTTTWDVPMSPPPLGADVPMSPPPLGADVPMSPLQPLISTLDEPMRPAADVSMTTGVLQLVSDPWDAELIAHLLSSITPSLTAHPRCISWQRGVPSIGPKMTISMGKASLRVDGLLGRGAFGTVYQATDPSTSEKMVLKVQKPANPWEFYINTQLDARVLPDLRHLYGSICSAHLFHDGSVMLGELYNYGTLLNAVNIYRSLAVKVMPQPLVLYFTVCILHMVEQLHAAGIVHADVKPDNFMLGDRFLDNRSFDPDSVDHGLVLIDMGQSIDMQLFPPGTAFTAKCLTSGFQCTEMLSGKPWNYQTDFFGIAGTVHCLLFGTYMQVTRDGGVWRSNGSFRRNPHSDLWQEFFHALLNVPDCSSPPSLGGLRARLASVLQDQYSSQLPALKSRLVVQLLESCRAPRR